MNRAVVMAWALVLAGAVPAQASNEIERLVAELGNEKGNACYEAYRELSRRHDPAMVSPLGKQIVGFARQGQQYGVYLLQAQPIEATRAVWSKLLHADSVLLRVAAAATLTRQNERGAVDKLAAALRSAPEGERAGLVHLTYGLDEQDEVFTALLAWLHPGAGSGTIVATLGRLARVGKRADAVRAATEPLAAAPDVATRAAALAILAGFSREHAESLTKLLQAEPERLRAVLSLLDTERKLPPVLLDVIAASLATAGHAYEITQTADLLRRQGSTAGVTYLRELLQHAKPEHRAAALEALAANGGGLLEKDLRALLQGDDPGAAVTAADLLRRRDDPSGLAVVLALVPKAGANLEKAVDVLGRFRDPQVVPVLLDLLDHAEADVRRSAWSGLQGLLRDLFPYRRFDFATCGYTPEAASRQAGITVLRAWWKAMKAG